MKQFLSAGALLLIFTVFALSFCVLRFSVEPTESAITATHVEGEGMGKLHVTFSESLARTVKDTWNAVKEAASALPFFVRDASDVVMGELRGLCASFGDALSHGVPSGATKI